MSGTVWMFSDQIDDEDIDFMHRESVFLTAGLHAGGACGGGALCSVPQASPLRPAGVTGA